MKNRDLYFGIVPPLLTPLAKDDGLDKDAFIRQIEHALKGGIHGLFPCSSSGESVHLPRRAWEEASRAALEIGTGKVPVYCGAIAPSTWQVIENIKFLEGIGAEIAVVTPPFYLPQVLQSEILRHYYAILEKTKIKLCIYNMPGLTGGEDIEPETIYELAKEERVVAFKDSCPNWDHHQRGLIKLRDRDIAVFSGGEELFGASLLFGSQGNISGLAMTFPKLFVQEYEAAKKGDMAKVIALQEKVLELKNINYSARNCFSAMKYALNTAGIGTDRMSISMEPLTVAEKKAIDAISEKFREYMH